MGTIRIVRKTNLNRETAVEIRIYGTRMLIDPQMGIYCASGAWISRENCIMSMATGFCKAGNHVVVERRSNKGQQWTYAFTPNNHVILCYYLLGFAQACGQWQRIVDTLHSHIMPTSRYSVLENTAAYYWRNPYLNEPIRLQLP